MMSLRILTLPIALGNMQFVIVRVEWRQLGG